MYHLEEQTKDILKLKSLSKYNHQGRSEASKVWGGGGVSEDIFSKNMPDFSTFVSLYLPIKRLYLETDFSFN